jgi:Transposase DNA-binding
MGQSIPLVCQDWANTKAAYRFFSNDRVSEEEILAGHFQSTRDRIAANGGPLLVLHDTTEFSFQREKPDAIGVTCRINSGRDKAGRLRSHTVCGILMHSSLAVTMEGIPVGTGRCQVLDQEEVQGNRGSQEEDQSDAGADREEGKRQMAGKPEAGYRAGR